MTQVLLTGVSGLFGSNAAWIGRERYRIHGIYNRNRVEMPGVTTEALDLTRSKDIGALVDRVRPDVIINAAAEANIDSCEKDRAAARKSNLEIPVILARHAADRGIRLVQFSTDAFFEGENRKFTENDKPTPLSYYGELKLEAERAVQAACPQSIILRTSFYGWDPKDGKGLAEWMVGRFKRGEPLPLFSDVVFTPLYVNTLAEVVFDLIELKFSGIIHAGASEAVSKLEFGTRICKLFGFDAGLIRPGLVGDSGLAARRSKCMALDSSKLQGLLKGRHDLSIDGGLKRFKTDQSAGHAVAVKRSIKPGA